MVAGVHTTTTASSITYSSVVSKDSVQIALTIATLQDLKVFGSDTKNAYLTANVEKDMDSCWPRIWFRRREDNASRTSPVRVKI